MDWFLELLREALAGAMAGEGTPLQKANAVARLGGLFLKAHRIKELEQANKQLAERVAELERTPAEREQPAADADAWGEASSSRMRAASAPQPIGLAAPPATGPDKLPSGGPDAWAGGSAPGVVAGTGAAVGE